MIVTSPFTDKDTDVVYLPGDEYTNKDKARLEELEQLGYIAKVPKASKSKAKDDSEG